MSTTLTLPGLSVLKQNVNKPNISHRVLPKQLCTRAKLGNIKTNLAFNSWAPELINGRCAMLGYVAGYGYEAVNHEPLKNQFVSHFPDFLLVSLFVTAATLANGKPTDTRINGLTPDVELFNGRAAMIGITSTLLYEFATNHVST